MWLGVREVPLKFTQQAFGHLGISTLAWMVWGNFFGKNLFDFGGVQTLARMVWGIFFRDEVPQSVRLRGGLGVGVQSLNGQCINAVGIFFVGASLRDCWFGG